MGKTSKSDFRQLDFISESQKCTFCQTTEINEIKYGPVYMHKNIVTHYYCLLLSSNMEQNGRDTDGILGFLAIDIAKEVRRGSKLYCSFCRGRGATLGCAIAKCKVVFHLPCGLKHGTLHQFFGEFKSFCNKHRPVQKIGESILAESSKGAMCGICYEKVIPRPVHDTLWAPCCQKSAFFHRECVQKLATSAGYFFKCPLCNNVDAFQQAMKEYGIFIPEQDASWERVPNAYQDLLVRHDTCDISSCKCPSGRKTNIPGTRWELILCKFCGSQGVHIGCGRLKWKSPEFGCEACSANSTEGNRSVQGDRHRLAPASSPALSNRDRERNRERARSESSEDSVAVSNRRRRVVSPRSSPSRSPSPEHRHRTASLDRRYRASTPERRHRATTPERRYRAPSPDRRRAPSLERRHRVSSPERKHRAPSPEYKHRAPTPEYKHRAPSPEYKHRAPSPEYKHRVASPEHRKSTHDTLKKKRREVKQYKSKAIVIDDSDDSDAPIEVVDITGVSGCLKINDGSTIQVVPVAGGQKRLRVEGDVRVLESDDLEVVDTNVKFPKVQVPSPPPLKEVVYSLAPPVNPQPSTSAATVPAFTPAQSYVLVDPNTFRPQDLPPGAVIYRSVQPMPQQPMQQQLGSASDADAQYSDCCKYRDWISININPQHIQAQEESSVKCDSAGQRRRRHHHNRLNPVVLLRPLQFRIINGYHEIYVREKRTLTFTKRNPSPLISKVAKKAKLSSTQDKKVGYSKKKKNSETKLIISKSLFSFHKLKEPNISKSSQFNPVKDKLQPVVNDVTEFKTSASTSGGIEEIKTETNEQSNIQIRSPVTSPGSPKKPKLNKSPLPPNFGFRKIEDYLIKVDKTPRHTESGNPVKDCFNNKENFGTELEFSLNPSNIPTSNASVSLLTAMTTNESEILSSMSKETQPLANEETVEINQPLVSNCAVASTDELNRLLTFPFKESKVITEEIKCLQQIDTNTATEQIEDVVVAENDKLTNPVVELVSESSNNEQCINKINQMTATSPRKHKFMQENDNEQKNNNLNESEILPSKTKETQPMINEDTVGINQALVSNFAVASTKESNMLASPFKENEVITDKMKCLQQIDTNTLSEQIEGVVAENDKLANPVVEPVSDNTYIEKCISKRSQMNTVNPRKRKFMQENNSDKTLDIKTKKRAYIKRNISVNKASMIDNYFKRVKKDTFASTVSDQSSKASFEGTEHSETPKSFFQLSSPAKMLEMARNVAKLFK